MGFRPISVEEKTAVLCEIIKNGKIEPVARGCMVSKPSVYVWMEKIPESSKERP